MGGESGLLTDDVHQAAGGILDISDGFCQVFQTMVPWSAKSSPRGSTQVNGRSALGHILDTIGGEEPD